MDIRHRRLRESESIRRLTRETRISAESLILPIFLKDMSGGPSPIRTLPGHFHHSPLCVPDVVEQSVEEGVNKFLLFGLPQSKDERGSAAWDEDGVVQRGLRALRARFHGITLVTDVCLCAYTTNGHCGHVKNGRIDNDGTLDTLSRVAVSHASAGADIVAPSDMMDGRIAAMRRALDADGFVNTLILSYAVKYASAFYEPFRDASDSAPAHGDRRTYQMDFHNRKEALKEAHKDAAEGADILMVKPALAYLDIIAALAAETNLPLAAYSVSGEYAMIKAAAAAGFIDEYRVMCESATAVFRAGAGILISYHARELAAAIKKGDIG